MVNTTNQFQKSAHMSSLKTFYSNKNNSKHNIDRRKISLGDMTPSLLLSPIHHFRHFHCETFFQSSKLIVQYHLLHPHLFCKNYTHKWNTSVSYIHRFLTGIMSISSTQIQELYCIFNFIWVNLEIGLVFICNTFMMEIHFYSFTIIKSINILTNCRLRILLSKDKEGNHKL